MQAALIALFALGGCSDVAAPPPADRTLTIEGAATDTAGRLLPGTQVRVRLNRHLPGPPFYGRSTRTDSTGRYQVRFDSLPESVDSVSWLAWPPGCDVDFRGDTLAIAPDIPTTGPVDLTQTVVMTTALPPAKGVVGRVCGTVSDDGGFGYSGWLRLIIDQATLHSASGNVVLVGRWNINWSPTYGDSNGIFLGLQTDSSVVLAFEEQGLGGLCPPVTWSASVDSIGNWGEFTPVIDGVGTCMWAHYPVMFARDTATSSWPW